MNKSWSLDQLDRIWYSYLNGKMLTLFPINLTSRNPIAKLYEGVSLNGKWVQAWIPLFALEAICPKCGKLMHHDFFEETNFKNTSWTIGYKDNNEQNLNFENLWPIHEECQKELLASIINQRFENKFKEVEK